MTKQTVAEIADRIAASGRELVAARADLELYERLAAARSTVDRLLKESKDLTKALSEAEDREEKARWAAIEAKFRNIGMSLSYATDNPTALLSATLAISWEEMRWDGRTAEWKKRSETSLNNLPLELFNLIVQRKPQVMPVALLDLCPGNPPEAVHTYLVALRRGYLAG